MIIAQISDTTVISRVAETQASTNFWMWLAIIEAAIVFSLIFILLYKSKRRTWSTDLGSLASSTKEDAKHTEIDMDNIIHSIARSRELYKELRKICHPDRFQNYPEKTISESIFKEVTRNKRNYKELLVLKERIKEELDIKF
ncbi:MAG: molecular chaperone DnaJ [Candidatus Brocadiales bacterium]|nr:molecular chaperone DnaJ [Candidatus Brocadiales bacterium]